MTPAAFDVPPDPHMAAPTPSQIGEFVDPGVGDPTRALRSTLRGIASIVAPASLVTALLYYFGWARTSYEAQALGLDNTLLGYSTQDYLLNSMSSMFAPLTIGVGAVLAALAFHAALVRWAGHAAGATDQTDANHPRFVALRALAVVLGATALVLLVLGALGERVKYPSRFVSLAAPVGVTVAIVFAGYAFHLTRRFLFRARGRRSTPELDSIRLIGSSLFIVLLFLSVFWSVSHYAGVKGVDLALLVEKDLPSRPDVTLYSGRRLYLRSPVQESQLGQDGSSYRFVYTGLKLLFRSGHNYFLRPADPSASDLNIIIPESPDLRLELLRGGL